MKALSPIQRFAYSPLCYSLVVTQILVVLISSFGNSWQEISYSILFYTILLQTQFFLIFIIYELVIANEQPKILKESLQILLNIVLVTLATDYLVLNYQKIYLFELPANLAGNVYLHNLLINLTIGAVLTYSLFRQTILYEHSSAHSKSVIQALQARIRPHFLFNSMNTLAELISTNPKLAEHLVVDMADLFRSSLRTNTILVSIEEEILLCKKYCRIEQIRLGNRMVVDWHVPELLTGNMPLFTLQPLLENAVYHGIQSLADGGKIVVNVQQDKVNTVITVTNPINSKHNAHKGSGYHIALENIKHRFTVLYGKKAKCHSEKTSSFYVVQLTVPIESVINDESIASR